MNTTRERKRIWGRGPIARGRRGRSAEETADRCRGRQTQMGSGKKLARGTRTVSELRRKRSLASGRPNLRGDMALREASVVLSVLGALKSGKETSRGTAVVVLATADRGGEKAKLGNSNLRARFGWNAARGASMRYASDERLIKALHGRIAPDLG